MASPWRPRPPVLTHVQVLLVLQQGRKPRLHVPAGRHLAGQVPQGPVQHPGRAQVGGVGHVVATLWVLPDPDAVRGWRGEVRLG